MSKRIKLTNQENNDVQMSPLMKAVKSIHSVSSSGDSIDLEDIKKQRSSQDLFGSISTPRNFISL